MRPSFALAPAFRPTAAVVGLFLLTACPAEENGDDGNTPTSIIASSGQGQNATVGTAVALPPAVLVQGSNGPIEGINVTFAVASGGGAIIGPAVVATNASGVATVGGWTLGPTAGANTLTATVNGLAAFTFNATANARVPTSITVSAGNNQNAPVGTAVAIDPAVLVQDATGPIPGLDVTFAVTGGGGAIVGTATVQTNGAGIATIGGWTLGATPGANSLSATVAPLAALTFNATGTARVPTSITVSAGNNQTATVGTAVPIPPAALVQDALGPIPGLDVTFAVTLGGGNITGPATVQTNANGIAAVGGWTLGGAAGPNTLTATVTPLAALSFNATGALVVRQLNVTAGNAQTSFAGNFPTTTPQVRLTEGGNPVSGVTVQFAVTAGGGTLTRASVATDASGNASPSAWRFGTAGAQTISASVPTDPGVTPVAVNGTANAVPASQYNIVVEFLGTPPSATQQAIFNAAAARWSQIIVGDIPTANSPADNCSVAIPQRLGIDDLHIFAVVQAIDGPGGILGQAGPCFIRTVGNLAISGVMIFDVADANQLEAAGLFDETVTHEMGHVLGIGTQWGNFPGGFDLLRPAACSAQGFYNGANTRQPFLASTNAGTYPRPIVPVEDNATLPCPGGTRDGHWKEEPFGGMTGGLDVELMTGFIEAPGVVMPLSAFSAASLRDMGYVVNDAAADPFTFTPPLTLRLMGSLTQAGIHLRNDLLYPIGEVDMAGRVRSYRR